MYLTGMGAAATMLPGIPVTGNPISPERALETIDPAIKKRLADVALNAARSKGATYTDVATSTSSSSPAKTKCKTLSTPNPMAWVFA